MPKQEASTIRRRQEELSEKIVELQYQRQPEVWKPYGSSGREKSVRDAGYHLLYLAEAVEANVPTLFEEYLAWVKVLFAGLKFPDHVLPTTLECTRVVLAENLPAGEREIALGILDAGAQRLAHASSMPGSYIQGHGPLDDLARRYLDALLQANRRAASSMILKAVESGIPVRDIYVHVFQPVQREIGRLWQTNQISVAQEHFCTAATQMIMSQLYPYIFTGRRKERTIVVTCVSGELHELGARMVADFFEMDGWDSHFLGANTPVDSILGTVADRRADILAISTTMTFHLGRVRDAIRSLHDDCPVRPLVLVGGYAFNLSPGLWRSVGADGYAPDAETAIQVAERGFYESDSGHCPTL